MVFAKSFCGRSPSRRRAADVQEVRLIAELEVNRVFQPTFDSEERCPAASCLPVSALSSAGDQISSRFLPVNPRQLLRVVDDDSDLDLIDVWQPLFLAVRVFLIGEGANIWLNAIEVKGPSRIAQFERVVYAPA